ncbi:MAG: acetyl-CoA carboxylase biotin carboxylase subunit [Betaproteobacteria bacterium RIFCSPLOWO2_12_FULL_65_14]|nr:MAG: acetyl-CoA carboxylase biotin carboxylase subunit [Betaproteobacteria bacterium RIFCSPLOWO2_12_FULL_65_14]
MNISRVLVANRGEIAVRIIRASQALGIDTVLVVSEADRDSLPSRMAGRTVCIGPARATDSYLNIKAIIASALGTASDAIHPGYGFLAESPELAQACRSEGIVFIGPTPEQIRTMGNKLLARKLADEYGLPILPGSERIRSYKEALTVTEKIGLPVMMKAAAGGGGRGMKVVTKSGDLQGAFESAAAEARAAFGDDSLYIERFIPNARHIEVQVFGDRNGNVIHLGERDCSLQRRHQKLIEETPAPSIDESLREQIHQAGLTLAREMKYENAGTVEFVVDQDTGTFHFLEMNTRIQVEHPVTEMITGVDLVQEQIRVAGGEALRFKQSDVKFSGHAIECRINAEVPMEGFRPAPGRIVNWVSPEGAQIRLDTHCYTGYLVPPYYDSLLGKLIVHGTNRSEALARMRWALDRFLVSGVSTTLEFLRFVIGHPEFEGGKVSTRLVETLLPEMLAVQRKSKHTAV